METTTTSTTPIVEGIEITTTPIRTLKYDYPEGFTSAQKKAFRRNERKHQKFIQKIKAAEAKELEEVTYLLPEAP